MTTPIAHVERKNQSLNTFTGMLAQASGIVNDWYERRRTRQQLAQMPAYLLRDIGLTEQDRQKELNKRFWQ